MLLLIPGPVVLYTLARSINQGRRAGLVSVLAAGLGDLCHVLAATFGLSAILLASANLFNLARYVGAAYLVYLGVRTLLAREDRETPDNVESQPLRRIFSQGFLVAALNPKTALFFLAFLPQFIDPSRGYTSLQILSLGVLFVVMGLCTNSAYSLVSSGAGQWLRNSRAFQRGRKYVAGTVYIALGVSAALAGVERS